MQEGGRHVSCSGREASLDLDITDLYVGGNIMPAGNSWDSGEEVVGSS